MPLKRHAKRYTQTLAESMCLISWPVKKRMKQKESALTLQPLGLFSGFPDLVLPEDDSYRLERSFSRELGDCRRGMKVVIIAETEPPETFFRQTDGRNRLMKTLLMN